MSQYIVRVELHGAATWNDYEALHTAMAQQGFSRTILGQDGRNYHLPTAEYYLVSSLTADQVRAAAVLAASSVGKAASVLITEALAVYWQNLQPV